MNILLFSIRNVQGFQSLGGQIISLVHFADFPRRLDRGTFLQGAMLKIGFMD